MFTRIPSKSFPFETVAQYYQTKDCLGQFERIADALVRRTRNSAISSLFVLTLAHTFISVEEKMFGKDVIHFLVI